MARLAVSGGGIAGMAAALAAARSGHEITLFSGRDAPPLVGGLQLAPNGWAALTTLGVADSAAAASLRLNDIMVRALDSGSTLIQLPLHEAYASFDRAALASCLSDALAAQPSVTRKSLNLEHIHQPGETVCLVTDDGASAEFDGLVAADGASGPGRRHVAPSASQIGATGRVAMRAQVPLATLPAHFALPTSNLWLGRGVHVVHYPIGHMLNLVVTMPAERTGPGWQHQMLPAGTPLAVLAGSDITWVKTPLPPAGTAGCWRRGSVVLAGEAAHSMPPHLAQGAGQGLQDAACLQGWLAAGDDMDAAFSGYARTRAGDVARIVRKADMSGRIMGLSGPAAHLRDIALNLGGGRLMQSWLAEVWAADPSLA
ncbi:MAG: FAD-dependent monooxygenase [Candidatus Puniceispirillaceae bacterium]